MTKLPIAMHAFSLGVVTMAFLIAWDYWPLAVWAGLVSVCNIVSLRRLLREGVQA